MDKQAVAKAFNEWMRRYVEEPERFEREFQTVRKFLAEEGNGQEPSYGESCGAYLDQLMNEPSGAAKSPPSAPAAAT